MSLGTLAKQARALNRLRDARAKVTTQLPRADGHAAKPGGGLLPPTSDEAFLQGWLKPKGVYGSAFASTGAAFFQDGSLEEYQRVRLQKLIGSQAYDAAQAAAKLLNLSVLEYGQVSPQITAWHDKIKPGMRLAVMDAIVRLLRQTQKMRTEAGQRITNKATAVKGSLSEANTLSLHLAMYLSLRQKGPVLNVDGLPALVGVSTNDAWSQPAWMVSGCQPSKDQRLALPLWMKNHWGTKSTGLVSYDATEKALLRHLGATTNIQGRAVLLAGNPAIGHLIKRLSPEKLVAALFMEPSLRQTYLSSLLSTTGDEVLKATALLKADLRITSKVDFKRFAPIVRLFIGTMIAEGCDDVLMNEIQAGLIGPEPGLKWTDGVALVFTVAGIIMAALAAPPVALAIVGAGGGAFNVGVKVNDYWNAQQEKDHRTTLIASRSAAETAVAVVEKPQSTDAAAMALMIEVLFAGLEFRDAFSTLKKVVSSKGMKEGFETPKAAARRVKKERVRVHNEKDAEMRAYGQVLRGKRDEITGARGLIHDRPIVAAPLDDAELKSLETFLKTVQEPATQTNRAKKAVAGRTVAASRVQSAKAAVSQSEKSLTEMEDFVKLMKERVQLEGSVPKFSEIRKMRSRRKAMLAQQSKGGDVAHLDAKIREIDTVLERYKRLKDLRRLTTVGRKRAAKVLDQSIQKIEEIAGTVSKAKEAHKAAKAQLQVAETKLEALGKELVDSLSTVRNAETSILYSVQELHLSRASALELQARYDKALAQIKLDTAGVVKTGDTVKGLRQQLKEANKRLADETQGLLQTDTGQAIFREAVKRSVYMQTHGSEFIPEFDAIMSSVNVPLK